MQASHPGPSLGSARVSHEEAELGLSASQREVCFLSIMWIGGVSLDI